MSLIFPSHRAIKAASGYPDAANLRAHLDLVTAAGLFSDTAHTTLAAIGDRIRSSRMVDGTGAVSYSVNATSDSASPFRRSGGASFGESVTSFLDTGIAQSNPYTIYMLCTRDTSSAGIYACDSAAETSTFAQHYTVGGEKLIWGQGGGYTLTGVTSTVSGSAVRGVVFNGTSTLGFEGAAEASPAGDVAIAAASWTARLGCSNNTYICTTTVRHALVYGGAHTITNRNLVRAFIATLP